MSLVNARAPVSYAVEAARGVASTRHFSSQAKQRQDAVIMKLRRKEEETKKYGAPRWQAVILAFSGVTAVGMGMWGWTQMDTRFGSLRTRSGF